MAVIVLFSRIIGILAFIFSLMPIIRTLPGVMGAMFWFPKLWASSWMALIAAFGFLVTMAGIITRDLLSIIFGILTILSGLRHIFVVTRPRGNFAQVFGPEWEHTISADQQKRFWQKRYRVIQKTDPLCPGQRDVFIGHSGTAGKPLLCDIWQPPENVKRTGLALVYFHGGAWQALDKDFLTQPLFRRLCCQGHVIMDVAYSLAPGADLDCMLGDVKQAILWMKAHAGEYQVNPGRVVLMGVSGGAHLAMLAAYSPDHPAFQRVAPGEDMSVRSVISMFGISDMSAFFEEYGRTTKRQPEYSSQITPDMLPRIYDKTWFDKFITRSRAFPAYRHANMPGGILLLVNLMGGTLKEIPETYSVASPIAHVGPHCPPTLQIFDDNDFVIDPSQGRKLHEALCEAGVKSVYIEIPETTHGFDQYFGVFRRIAPAAQSATYDVERFLALMV